MMRRKKSRMIDDAEALDMTEGSHQLHGVQLQLSIHKF